MKCVASVLASLAALLCTVSPTLGQSSGLAGTAALIDISGSMRELQVSPDVWGNDLKAAMEAILFGGPVDPAVWIRDGVEPDEGAELRNLVDGGRGVLVPSSPFMVLSFGQPTNRHPYFRRHSVVENSSTTQARAHFEAVFPSTETDFRDPWTYMFLAKRVIADEMYNRGVRRYLLLVASDYREDQGGAITALADSLANAYETQVNEQGLLTFAYAQDRRLKLRLYSIELPVVVDEPPLLPTRTPDARIRLTQPVNDTVFNPRADTVRFRWRDPSDIGRYELFVHSVTTDERLLRVTLSRKSHLWTPDSNKPLPVGRYRWHVVGVGEDRQRVRSTVSEFEVARYRLGQLILFLLLVGGALVAMRIRTKPRPAPPVPEDVS